MCIFAFLILTWLSNKQDSQHSNFSDSALILRKVCVLLKKDWVRRHRKVLWEVCGNLHTAALRIAFSLAPRAHPRVDHCSSLDHLSAKDQPGGERMCWNHIILQCNRKGWVCSTSLPLRCTFWTIMTMSSREPVELSKSRMTELALKDQIAHLLNNNHHHLIPQPLPSDRT
jgi:hypothetical protein